MLEVVDRGFDEIAQKIDDYSRAMQSKTIDEISDEGLNSLSLQRYIDELAADAGIHLYEDDISADLV